MKAGVHRPNAVPDATGIRDTLAHRVNQIAQRSRGTKKDAIVQCPNWVKPAGSRTRLYVGAAADSGPSFGFAALSRYDRDDCCTRPATPLAGEPQSHYAHPGCGRSTSEDRTQERAGLSAHGGTGARRAVVWPATPQRQRLVRRSALRPRCLWQQPPRTPAPRQAWTATFSFEQPSTHARTVTKPRRPGSFQDSRRVRL